MALTSFYRFTIPPEEEEFKQQLDIFLKKHQGIQSEKIESDRVKVKMSNAEKQKKKREYRKNYYSRPEVIEKMMEKTSDPEERRKRLAYASDPEVKERKREMSKKRRLMLKVIQEENHDYYKELKDRIMPPPLKRRKKEEVKEDSASQPIKPALTKTTERVQEKPTPATPQRKATIIEKKPIAPVRFQLSKTVTPVKK